MVPLYLYKVFSSLISTKLLLGILFLTSSIDFIEFFSQIGVSNIVVYINHCDMDESWPDIVELEIRQYLSNYGFDGDNITVIYGSTSKVLEGNKKYDESIHELIKTMDSWEKEEVTTVGEYSEFESYIYLFSRDENKQASVVFEGDTLQIKFDSGESEGIVFYPEGIDMLMPGDYTALSLKLNKNVTFKKGDNFEIVKDGNIIGVGTVTNIIE